VIAVEKNVQTVSLNSIAQALNTLKPENRLFLFLRSMSSKDGRNTDAEPEGIDIGFAGICRKLAAVPLILQIQPVILKPMLRSRYKKILLIVTCIAMLAMRVSGVHLHYCFDGSEPPVSLHLVSDANAHDTIAESSQVKHVDTDVSSDADPIAKKGDVDPGVWALVLAFVICTMVASRQIAFSFESLLPVSTFRAYILPPLRGPPL